PLHDALPIFALADGGAVAGGGVEGGYAGAAGAHLLRQGALGGEDHFQLAAHHLLFEQFVLAHVGGHHGPDLLVLQEDAEAEAVDAAVVGYHGQALHAHFLDLLDQVLGDAANAEAAGNHGHAVAKASHGLLVTVHYFVKPGHQVISCGWSNGVFASKGGGKRKGG